MNLPQYQIYLFLTFSLIFMKISFCLIPPGRNNSYYLIDSYYGSRNQEYYTRDAILNDELTTFQWFTNFDYDPYNNRLYFADRVKHVIQYRNLQTDEMVLVAGIEDFAGNRNGDLKNTLFNTPTALKIFRYNKVKAQKERRKIMIILKDNTLECQHATFDNYTNCQDTTTADDETAIDPSLIKAIYPAYDPKYVTEEDLQLEALSGKMLYVMDKDNHCIRKLNLEKQVSETFAGICGTAGFKDGPLGVNLFTRPGSFGMDELGNVFILDEGNIYLRITSQNGYTQTLIKGACDESPNNDPDVKIMPNMHVRFVTCYRKWIKTSGLPDSHIFTDLTNLEKCFRNDVLCGGIDRSHPILYKSSSFRGNETIKEELGIYNDTS